VLPPGLIDVVSRRSSSVTVENRGFGLTTGVTTASEMFASRPDWRSVGVEWTRSPAHPSVIADRLPKATPFASGPAATTTAAMMVTTAASSPMDCA
jgi:hypothetical protein